MNLHPNGSNFALASVDDEKFGRFKQLELEDDDEDNDDNNDDNNIQEDDDDNDESKSPSDNETKFYQQKQMSLEQIICEDLIAFENRLTEIVQNFEPKAKRWRWILALSILTTITTATSWLLDVETFESSFWQSLWNHPWFSLNCCILICLFLLFGIHNRVIQHQIIAQRIRDVLGQFNMGCDDHARLILMPRPSSFFNGNHPNHQQQHQTQPQQYFSHHLDHQNYAPPYHSNGFR